MGEQLLHDLWGEVIDIPNYETFQEKVEDLLSLDGAEKHPHVNAYLGTIKPGLTPAQYASLYAGLDGMIRAVLSPAQEERARISEETLLEIAEVLASNNPDLAKQLLRRGTMLELGREDEGSTLVSPLDVYAISGLSEKEKKQLALQYLKADNIDQSVLKSADMNFKMAKEYYTKTLGMRLPKQLRRMEIKTKKDIQTLIEWATTEQGADGGLKFVHPFGPIACAILKITLAYRQIDNKGFERHLRQVNNLITQLANTMEARTLDTDPTYREYDIRNKKLLPKKGALVTHIRDDLEARDRIMQQLIIYPDFDLEQLRRLPRRIVEYAHDLEDMCGLIWLYCTKISRSGGVRIEGSAVSEAQSKPTFNISTGGLPSPLTAKLTESLDTSGVRYTLEEAEITSHTRCMIEFDVPPNGKVVLEIRIKKDTNLVTNKNFIDGVEKIKLLSRLFGSIPMRAFNTIVEDIATTTNDIIGTNGDPRFTRKAIEDQLWSEVLAWQTDTGDLAMVSASHVSRLKGTALLPERIENAHSFISSRKSSSKKK